MSIMVSVQAICQAEMEGRMQQAAQELKEELENKMRQSIDSVVYAAGTPEAFARTYAYREGWRADASASGLACTAMLKYMPTGSHPSVNGINDVTGYLDSIIIDSGSNPQVKSFANEPRDHFTQVDAEAESIANAIIKKCLG